MRKQLNGQFTDKLIFTLNFALERICIAPLTDCQKYSDEEFWDIVVATGQNFLFHLAFKRIKENSLIYWRLSKTQQQHHHVTRHSNTNSICPKYNRETEGSRTFVVVNYLPTMEQLKPKLGIAVSLEVWKFIILTRLIYLTLKFI